MSATLYLDVDHVRELIRQIGLREVLRGMADHLAADFGRWSAFDHSPRVAAHSALGVIELMPVSDGERYAFKFVNGHPGNAAHRLPTVMAFGAWAEVATGLPLMISEMTLTTALRTAATSALAARVLARPDARTMAIIGNGAQSECQALAFQTLLGIHTCRLYDIDPAATARMRRNLTGSGLRLIACSSVAEAVEGADVVTTITADKRQATILDAGLVDPGMHLNAVGGDCPGKTELDPRILERARVVVELEAQTRIEGEIQRLPADFPVVELWRIIQGQAPGRRDAAEITVFDSVGFALEDFSALRYLYENARRLGLGERLELVPAMADPRDLYGLMMAPGRAQGPDERGADDGTPGASTQTRSKIAAMPWPPPMHMVTSA